MLGLDARPLDGEPIRVQTEAGEEPDVIGIAVIVIAGVAGWLDKQSGSDVLEDPQVAVYVVAFYLVCGRRRTP